MRSPLAFYAESSHTKTRLKNIMILHALIDIGNEFVCESSNREGPFGKICCNYIILLLLWCHPNTCEKGDVFFVVVVVVVFVFVFFSVVKNMVRACYLSLSSHSWPLHF